jgi:hypothetical protein
MPRHIRLQAAAIGAVAGSIIAASIVTQVIRGMGRPIGD